MRFEDRLAAALLAVMGAAAMGACDTGGDTTDGTDGTDGTTPTPAELEALCDGGTPPENYSVALGHVEIALGGTCPDPADAQLVVNSCSFLEWQDITCAFDHEDTNQVLVNNGYGGEYYDAATAPTGGTYTSVGDPVDVCYYTGVFYLDPDHPTCGRPLLQDGAPVVAALRPGASPWSDAAAPDAAALSADDRAALAAHWQTSAALEHASVASFAAFSLELMRFGAPPALLAAAHRAALDEITHAQVCFALANGYGAPASPGELPLASFTARPVEDVVEALFREGCVGETLAAVDAAARLARATDPAVRAVLEGIVRDESAHAAFAWRALGWFLAEHGTEAVHARLNAAFDAEAARWRSLPVGGAAVSAAARAHGLLDDATRARALRDAWDTVVAPAWGTAAASWA